jgi:hypothetical protein
LLTFTNKIEKIFLSKLQRRACLSREKTFGARSPRASEARREDSRACNASGYFLECRFGGGRQLPESFQGAGVGG